MRWVVLGAGAGGPSGFRLDIVFWFVYSCFFFFLFPFLLLCFFVIFCIGGGVNAGKDSDVLIVAEKMIGWIDSRDVTSRLICYQIVVSDAYHSNPWSQ